MGAGASLQDNFGGVTIEERTVQLYPAYMIQGAVVDESDLEHANISWKMIIDDESPEYLRLKGTDGFDKASCLTWFFDQFYIINSVLDEASASLYEDSLRIQIRALTGMINASLNMFKGQDLEKVNKILNSIARGHATKGVRAFQYPTVGEIFMLTMKHCLGTSYTDEIDLAWTKIFSVMLTIVIPAALREERALDKERQKEQKEKDQQEQKDQKENERQEIKEQKSKDRKEQKDQKDLKKEEYGCPMTTVAKKLDQLIHQSSTSTSRRTSLTMRTKSTEIERGATYDDETKESLEPTRQVSEPFSLKQSDSNAVDSPVNSMISADHHPALLESALLVSSSMAELQQPASKSSPYVSRTGSIHVRRASVGSIKAFSMSADSSIVIPDDDAQLGQAMVIAGVGAFALNALDSPSESQRE